MQYLLEADDPQGSPRAASSSVAASSLEEEIKQRVQYLYDRYANYPALAGLNLFDELHRSYFGRLRSAKDEVELKFEGEELPYVNIWPSYASPRAPAAHLRIRGPRQRGASAARSEGVQGGQLGENGQR